MALQIPQEDVNGAISMIDDGTGRYALYKDAGPSWQGGYLVITKAAKGRRKVKHVESKVAAETAVKKFMDWID